MYPIMHWAGGGTPPGRHLKADVTAEVSSLTRLTNDALIQDTSFWLKCRKLRCHDFSALAD